MITEMERSPEVLREFYLIAINKDSALKLSDGTGTSEYSIRNGTVLQENLDLQALRETASHSEMPSHLPETGSSKTNDIDKISDENGSGGLRPKTFLKIVQQASRNSVCRQCRLYQFHCDRQKPSCYKCERYSLPCYYENEEADDGRPSTDEPSPDLIPWEESAKLNPYQQLGGRQKLHRINRPPARRGHLSKPMPLRKIPRPRIEDSEKEEEAMLLASLSPIESDIEEISICLSPVSVSTMSRAASPISRPASPMYHLKSVVTSRPASESISILRLGSPAVTEIRPASQTVSEIIEEHEPSGASPSETGEVSPISRPVSPIQQADSRSVSSVSRPNSSRSTSSSASNNSAQSQPTESSTRRSLSILTIPSITGATGSCLPPLIENTWNNIPPYFQCTFCLQHCSNQDEWERHEVLHHIQRRIWICMPNGPVERAHHCNYCVFCGVADPSRRHGLHHAVEECCYDNWHRDRTFVSKDSLQRHLSAIHHQSEMTPRMHRWFQHPKDDEWYWSCGFCDVILPTWTKRVDHIAAHFNEGAVMSYWDPLLPPHPLDRTTMSCAAWFPALNWDAGTLWDLRSKRIGWSWVDSVEEQYLCKHCDINVYFRSLQDTERHEYIWHSHRETWSCPTTEDIAAGDLARFFFPGKTVSSSLDDSVCPLCANHFIDIANWYPDIDDIWDIRARHLAFDHNFDCEASSNFASADHLLLHLANVHKVGIIGKTTSTVLESCRRDGLQLAEQMMRGVAK